MKLIFFSKALKTFTTDRYIVKAHEIGVDGFELCVRPGFTAVNPDNIESALPAFVADCKKDGLVVPIIASHLVDPDDPASEVFLRAMDKADARMVKLFYYYFGRHKNRGYWDEVEKLKRTFVKWQNLGKKYGVKVLYHNHSLGKDGPHYMGSNASGIMHFIRGLDPRYIGVFLDPAHLRAEGEQFDFAIAITEGYLSAVALKDLEVKWDVKHYQVIRDMTHAGKGMVEWDLVMSELARIGFDGPLSAHMEYVVADEREFFEQLPKEVAFFKEALKKAQQEKMPKYQDLMNKW